MKKYIICLALAALCFTACDKTNEILVDPVQTVRLNLSSSQVVLGADGGSKTVLVATNGDAWESDTEADWLTLTRGTGDEIILAAGANTDGETRYATVVVNVGDVQAECTVAQLAEAAVTDLSETEPANCYIVPTGTTVCFDATVKGNGLASTIGGVGAYIEKFGLTIDPQSIVYADLLWEATLDADKTGSRQIIGGMPVYSNGKVYFTTGKTQGNAVIAVFNADSRVLWSWHIWVTDAEIAETEGNGHRWMDRNLGAQACVSGTVQNRGLLYQWGRKDPFLPSSAPYDPSEPAYNPDDDHCNIRNTTVGKGCGEWRLADYFVPSVVAAPGNIALSVERPMTFLADDGNDARSWYIPVSNDDACTAHLWGDSTNPGRYVKSIFDPCPAGYTVPVNNPWISATDYDTNIWSVSPGENGRYWKGGNEAFYPSAGYIDYTGYMGYTGLQGAYWTSGSISDTSIGVPMLIFSTASISYSASYPGYAFSVRCMKAE